MACFDAQYATDSGNHCSDAIEEIKTIMRLGLFIINGNNCFSNKIYDVTFSEK
jgi:hypothetical protein